MIVQYGIPILATIIEPVMGIVMIFNALLIFRKYRERKGTAILFLGLSILMLGFAATSSGIGKILQYNLGNTLNYSNYYIVIAYIFTALGNGLLIEFIVQIFKDGNFKMAIIFPLLNGITVGLLIPNISYSADAYNNILPYLIWHVIISLTTYFYLAKLSFKEAKHAKQRITRTGFILIGFYGIFGGSLYLLFIIDLVFNIVAGVGFTVFYYAAWIVGWMSTLTAYLGYVMPNWLKKRLQ